MGLHAHSPSNLPVLQLISPPESPLNLTRIPLPSHLSPRARTYASAAAVMSVRVTCSDDSLASSERRRCSEHLGSAVVSSSVPIKDCDQSVNKAAWSLNYPCNCADRNEWSEVPLPIGCLCLAAVSPSVGPSVPTPQQFKEPQSLRSNEERASNSPEVAEMDSDNDGTGSIKAIVQKVKHVATNKMAATPRSDVTSKMAAATSKMATNVMANPFTMTAAFNPDMPSEMATCLPASADMLLNLIKNLRVELRNDFKKDFEAIYGFMSDINLRTEDAENLMTFQEQSHLELLEKVNDLQRQVNQQAENQLMWKIGAD
ncbi:Hypothetical predicted protein [Pelobates cultripes]|uniref:Uncharacterized protein n=1 Tax=Pelobates cultripes TaxID=61616 RepID=A0AAD1W923_PELCU|nr:Hypothetical predicted protein [Pelobates cultripes]